MLRKRALIFIASLAMSFCFMGCGINETEITTVEDNISNNINNKIQTNSDTIENTSEEFEVTAEEIFDYAGYYELEITTDCIVEVSTSQECFENDVAWIAYILNSEFEDAPRFIPQDQEDLIDIIEIDPLNKTEITVQKGNYIYFYCSENSFTSDSKEDLTDGAALFYSIKTNIK